jgi:alpha-amylase/alpha-mannosidase (GH57 family)
VRLIPRREAAGHADEVALRIAILWHMHQPDYRHPDTGEEDWPWVRLHALKDYYDMARLVDEAPEGLVVTFNLTPPLLLQLDQLASRGPRDTFYKLCRRPISHLRHEERLFLLNNLFSVNEERMMKPLPHFERLQRLAGRQSGRLTVLPPRFGPQDYLDLEVLFHLAWCGRTLRENELVRQLIAKGTGFSESERGALLDLQDDFFVRIVPLYRRLWVDGRIEISTSPLHHPILPLLVDVRSAREGNPRLPIEGLGFHFAEDAREQIGRGRELAAHYLGHVPPGMWPSEGGVSDAVVRMLEATGIRWIATDKQILERSLVLSGTHVGSAPHLRPWLLRGTERPLIFFRDTPLSDRIGFTYSRWPVPDAVADFIARVRSLGASDPEPDDACVPVILDGENAWEYYEDNGASFLTMLYQAISQAPDLKTVTMGQAADTCPARILPRIQAGSWINAGLDTWIGHPEKNRAWELLSEARSELKDQSEGHESDPEALTAAREHLLRSEASDWFWWLGDDHPSFYKDSFEELFRTNLRAAWRALGRPAPAALHRSITEVSRAVPVAVRQPVALIRPIIDGRNNSYFQWIGAGSLDAAHQSGAIFLGQPLITRLDFGFDLERLYLRLTPVGGLARDVLREQKVRLLVRDLEQENEKVVFGEAPPSSGEALLDLPLFLGGPDGKRAGAWAIDRVCELAMEFAPLKLKRGRPFSFCLEISLPDGLAERLPMEGSIETVVPPPNFNQLHWSL